MTDGLVSVGYLSEILTLIERTAASESQALAITTIADALGRAEYSVRPIVNAGQRFGWFEGDEQVLTISNDPRSDGDEPRIVTLRSMLIHMIRETIPTWAHHLRKGAANVNEQVSSSNERQLFRELRLLLHEGQFQDVDASRWWGEAQEFGWTIFNSRRARELAEVGRIGERLSIEHEHQRTENPPVHVAIIDAGAGYDINSRQSETNPTQIQIEVKATKSPRGCIYITRNEAKVCSERRETYFVHIWLLHPTERNSLLGVFTADEVLKHFPNNQGMGHWVDVEIPVAAFGQDRFQCPFSPGDC